MAPALAAESPSEELTGLLIAFPCLSSGESGKCLDGDPPGTGDVWKPARLPRETAAQKGVAAEPARQHPGGAVSGNHGNPVLLPCAGEPPLPAWAPLVPALPEGKSKLSGRGINKALNAALQNGSKLPHPIESPPGSLASFPRATSVPGFVHDKVKLRATYFLGCFNSFAAHPFSPLSGEPGHWQHATLATS